MKTGVYRKGVGAVIINDDKKIFLACRLEPAGAWQLPQGGIDEGETPNQAILRELLEEIGTNMVTFLAKTDWLKYNFPEETHYMNDKYIGQEQIWYAFKYIGEDNDIDLENHDEVEFSEWKWTTKEDSINSIVDFKKELYKTIFTEFKDFLE